MKTIAKSSEFTAKLKEDWQFWQQYCKRKIALLIIDPKSTPPNCPISPPSSNYPIMLSSVLSQKYPTNCHKSKNLKVPPKSPRPKCQKFSQLFTEINGVFRPSELSKIHNFLIQKRIFRRNVGFCYELYCYRKNIKYIKSLR